jgi:hypothetical protein
MSDTTPEDAAPNQPPGDSDLSAEEYGSLTIEDDPDGTVDPAELANTADESDHDLPDSGTQPDQE